MEDLKYEGKNLFDINNESEEISKEDLEYLINIFTNDTSIENTSLKEDKDIEYR